MRRPSLGLFLLGTSANAARHLPINTPPAFPQDLCTSYPEIHWQVTQSMLYLEENRSPGRKTGTCPW